MKLLVFGKTGQVAQELIRRCPKGFDVKFLGRGEADLFDPESCAQAILRTNVDAVINVAAWTAVDKAEEAETLATLVNGLAPETMSQVCFLKAIPFIHVSTDYVFSGHGSASFTPDQETRPLGAYGRSKLLGEERIRASGAQHLILRTSWVVSAHRENFIKTMLRLGAQHNSLRVVCDQIGGPTPASSIANSLYLTANAMAKGHSGGTYHFTGAPDTSWADFARTIIKEAGLSCRIVDVPAVDYPTLAKRPMNSRLDCGSFEKEFGIIRPDWKTELKFIIDELGVQI